MIFFQLRTFLFVTLLFPPFFSISFILALALVAATKLVLLLLLCLLFPKLLTTLLVQKVLPCHIFLGKKTENDCLLISRANTHMNYSYLEKKLRFAKCQVYCQVFKPILVQTASKRQSFQTCIMYFLEFPLTPLAFLALVV